MKALEDSQLMKTSSVRYLEGILRPVLLLMKKRFIKNFNKSYRFLTNRVMNKKKNKSQHFKHHTNLTTF